MQDWDTALEDLNKLRRDIDDTVWVGVIDTVLGVCMFVTDAVQDCVRMCVCMVCVHVCVHGVCACVCAWCVYKE